MVFIFRLATLRIRIFECPHRLSDKLLKSSLLNRVDTSTAQDIEWPALP
ncbi:tail fiber assembly protein [Escherichia coli]